MTEMDVIGQNEGMTLSAKYDERYLYLLSLIHIYTLPTMTM